MHPAVSVIFFTVASGAGFGLIFLLGLGFPVGDGALRAFIVSLAGGGLAVAGLLASTFHLGHPERAWRALSQWRSSWLSREGIAAIVTLCLFGLYALVWMWSGARPVLLGVLVALGAATTVFTTAMIYAQLRTVPQWKTRLTPAVYMSFALASGWLLASALGNHASPEPWGIALVALAWAVKWAWWVRGGRARLSDAGSTPETATGLGFIGKVRLLERPHSGENYLTRDMVHVIGRKHARTLRVLALLLGAGVPVAILTITALTGAPAPVNLLAALSMLLGLLAERWLFFAEAQHAVSLYYGKR
ncbi:MAG: dimethyl sulfoxide reductase anchor subunit [Hoeflea sp.]|uniref:dimethyl sulfoxide reductase anchor subunit family protein n=1 Tax=Hoeflea sp. TaxID=1940281 RepID=UPI001DB3E93C|nr:DmsC/YnfH family molybdoenzyme membrane anchor subunit [Hoeflea sp.]MBU4531674.1 dimethyl sulfoxide reductase anchor subunit [Alphaproteobacteria bacterium]MBU4544531.1 dimethyl sulfoxide reductase anchor subunit [Alphaproteobacteria bacterium]MBU4552762.1 dimethyl sulfoxide reductase anchor subunit [Alphaproteobacteria bacterium]MBV1724950.1 dimethyl sulfoxide reductase anchor subunit [Hoeflea sp.]MBV1760970.1 dimethyl sulfoxide reductase anchor subunit [Hoeflea sp.]